MEVKHKFLSVHSKVGRQVNRAGGGEEGGSIPELESLSARATVISCACGRGSRGAMHVGRSRVAGRASTPLKVILKLRVLQALNTG